MADHRLRAIADLEALDRAAERCEGQLAAARLAYQVGLTSLRRGATVAKALDAGNSTSMRWDVTAALEALEQAHRTSRVSLFLADIAEGSSVKAVASRWGVSRQLVSRSIRLAEPGTSGVTTLVSTTSR